MRPAPSRYRRKSSVSRAYPRPKAPSQKTLQYVVLAVLIFTGLLFLVSPSNRFIDLRRFHHTPTHRPPVQKNSTSGDVRWFNDFKWLNPFSASITLDEDRSVLPPLKQRPPIYAFYDTEAEKEETTRAAENKLLLLWRRAWWAQGFRPVILGRPEAMNNPLYELFQAQKLQPQLEGDLVRWLAWGQMGTGLLANWLVLPMGPRDDHLLSHLRRGEYPKLTRYEGLGAGLFSGEKADINAAIKGVLDISDLKTSKSILDVVNRASIKVESTPSAIAFYDANTNAEHYSLITATLTSNKAEGLSLLAQLITSHLQTTFLNSFPDGFNVLTPYAEKAQTLTQNAHALANALRTCPSSPLPESCPPNNPSCTPCSSISPPPIKSPEHYTNTSRTYTIGTIPHPYTLASLLAQIPTITTRHIRRDTSRDRWLSAITSQTLGPSIGGPARIVSFKETVASSYGFSHGLWLTEEIPPEQRSLEYHFGFPLPIFNISLAITTLPPPPNSAVTLPNSKKEHKAAEQALQTQQELLDQARGVLRGKEKGLREMVEAWNLADTEAWRFVRAFGAREGVERVRWEEEERSFAGGLEGGKGGWRWFDR